VGPGDRPLIAAAPFRVYLDLSRYFLASLRGQRVVGDICACPLRDDAFDLAVAVDVLTHVVPARRRRAVQCLARLAPRLLMLVNPIGATGLVDSRVPVDAVVGWLVACGFHVDRTDLARYSPRLAPAPFVLLEARRVDAGGTDQSVGNGWNAPLPEARTWR
jgi:hypothetical protein